MQTQQLLLDRNEGEVRAEVQQTWVKRRRGGEYSTQYTPHYSYLASEINMFSDLVREREPNMELDRSKMPVFTFLGSDANDNNQPLDQSKEHETMKEYKETEPTQKISSVMDNVVTLQCYTIE